MSLNRNPRKSIITPCDSEPSYVNTSNHNHNYHRPLINSAIGLNTMSDSEIARQLGDDNLMDTDESLPPPPVAAAAAAIPTFNSRRLEEIDADAALARKLQEEEYTKKSFFPHPYRSTNEKFSPFVIDPEDDERTMNDAQIAAQLQEEENQNQGRNRSRPGIPTQRRIPHPTTNRTNAPEVIPFPLANRSTRQPTQPRQPPQPRPSSATNNNPTVPDLTNLFQLFMQSALQATSNNRGAQGIENSDRDFGPEDYEDLLELDNSTDLKPLPTDQINRLPTHKFRSSENKNSEENKCNICWDQFEDNQTVRRLPCLHLYHKDCIDPWLQRSNLCPICRNATN